MCVVLVSELCFKPFWTKQEAPGGHVTKACGKCQKIRKYVYVDSSMMILILLSSNKLESPQYPGVLEGFCLHKSPRMAQRTTQMDFVRHSNLESL